MGSRFPPTKIFVGGTNAGTAGVVAVWVGDVVVVDPVVLSSRGESWGTKAAARVESPSRISITISRRRAAIRWRRVGRALASRRSQRYGCRRARRLAHRPARRSHD